MINPKTKKLGKSNKLRKDILFYRTKISSACHTEDILILLSKDLYIFKKYMKLLKIPKSIIKKMSEMYTLGLISYNSIDSIADEESDAKELNLFLSYLLEYVIYFNSLIDTTENRGFLSKISNSINRQYLQCANNPRSIKFQKIQGARSLPYIIPYILALFLSPVSKYRDHYRDIIKCCFCFCTIRQSSDDLKDLDEDIEKKVVTLPTLLYRWEKSKEKINYGTENVKRCITENTLKYCNQNLMTITKLLERHTVPKKTCEEKNLIDNPMILIISHWHQLSSKIISGIDKYNSLLKYPPSPTIPSHDIVSPD